MVKMDTLVLCVIELRGKRGLHALQAGHPWPILPGPRVRRGRPVDGKGHEHVLGIRIQGHGESSKGAAGDGIGQGEIESPDMAAKGLRQGLEKPFQSEIRLCFSRVSWISP